MGHTGLPDRVDVSIMPGQVVELAVVPAGAVRLLQPHDRDVEVLGEVPYRPWNRLPIFSNAAGDGSIWHVRAAPTTAR